MGRAERIKGTVFPVTYRLFLHVFIYLFLLVLSLALVEVLGVFEVPIPIPDAFTGLDLPVRLGKIQVEVIDLFLQDSGKRVEDLQRAASAGNPVAAARAAHALKSASASVGAAMPASV